jgi:hypothetical protein
VLWIASTSFWLRNATRPTGKEFAQCFVFGDGQLEVIQHNLSSAFVGDVFTDGFRKQV